MLFISSLAILWMCTTAFIKGAHGDLHMDYNKDYFRDEEGLKDDFELDACNLDALPNVAGYCYCTPDNIKVEDVSCNFWSSPLSEAEWRALSRLHTATTLKFNVRPIGAIRTVPPDYMFSGMRKLYYFIIKMAHVHFVPSFAFGNSSSLSEIRLSLNSIGALSPNSFANLPNLTDIHLSENNLTEIMSGVFVNLPKMRQLVLAKNTIHTIHDYAFRDLKTLEDLDLQKNQLTVITREVFSGLERVRTLNLEGNQIKYIGDHVFAEMPRLQDLDLTENNIHSISPKGFAGLRFITRLNLKGNKIVNLLPETFNPFSKIHFLDLRNNELETLNLSLMKPIYKNLIDLNMQLLIEGNRFACDCRIIWIQKLFNDTKSINVKEHISATTCDLFESANKHATSSAPSSRTVFHTEGTETNPGVTILTSPLEETTAYAFESNMGILNLTSHELGCSDEVINHESNDQHYTYHQHVVPKEKNYIGTGNGNGKIVIDLNKEASLQNSQVEKISPELKNELFQHDHHHHHHHQNSDTNLGEPEATAALEGADFMGTAPKSDQKPDAARTSFTHASSSVPLCDSLVLMVSLLAGVCLSPILK